MAIYLYDGTWEAYLTLLHKLTFDADETSLDGKVYNLRLSKKVSFPLFCERIEPSESRIKELKEYISEFGDRALLKDLYYWYLCDKAEFEIPLTRCLRKLKEDPQVFQRPHLVEAVKLQKAKKALFRERHRWLGFLRFYSPKMGVLFAYFEPANNVLPLIGNHFLKRFPRERIVIVDTLRGLLFIGQRERFNLLFLEDWEIDPKAIKDPFVELWKTYFNEIAVPERINRERQKSRVPLKLRPFLPEFSED